MTLLKKRKPSRVGELIDGVLGELEKDTPYRPEAVATVSAWPAVVEGRVSEFSRAVSLRDGRLIVEVTEPAWKQELLLNKKKIIRRLNRRMGAPLVGDIVIKVRNFIHGEQ
jgi:predicted nucleic acid-binding Zn ribbon protein